MLNEQSYLTRVMLLHEMHAFIATPSAEGEYEEVGARMTALASVSHPFYTLWLADVWSRPV